MVTGCRVKARHDEGMVTGCRVKARHDEGMVKWWRLIRVLRFREDFFGYFLGKKVATQIPI